MITCPDDGETQVPYLINLDDIKIDNHKFLSILPLSHAYERTGGFLLPVYIGGEIFFSNNRDQLLNDLHFVNPTLMVAVPRLYDVLLKKISNSIKSKNKIIKYLFEKNLILGNKKYNNELRTTTPCSSRCFKIDTGVGWRGSGKSRPSHRFITSRYRKTY